MDDEFLNPENWNPDCTEISKKRGITPQATRQWYKKHKNEYKLKITRKEP